MVPLFADDDEWVRFHAICASWEGTPYRHLQRCKGRGVDCTLLVGECWLEADYMDALEYDYYPKDWHIHTHQELVLDSMVLHMKKHLDPRFQLIGIEAGETLMRGDVPTFAMSQTGVTNHAGIMYSPTQILHASQLRGTMVVNLTSSFVSQMTHVYRLYKVEE